MVVRFVTIGGIGVHHYYNLLFIMNERVTIIHQHNNNIHVISYCNNSIYISAHHLFGEYKIIQVYGWNDDQHCVNVSSIKID